MLPPHPSNTTTTNHPKPHALPSTLIVHYTHAIWPSTRRELARLQHEAPPDHAIAITGCCPTRQTLAPLQTPQTPVTPLTRHMLRALPYPQRHHNANWATLRGLCDLPLLHLYRQKPTHDFYWFIEHDVRYTGHWGQFFTEMDTSEADLLCTRLHPQTPESRWPHWASFTANPPQPNIPLVCGFLPIHRASSRLLHLIDALCRQGWGGHPEVLWPTAAAHHGLSLEEIGGNGAYTPAHRRRRFYRPVAHPSLPSRHTFAPRPPITDGHDLAALGPDTLWHPVKG